METKPKIKSSRIIFDCPWVSLTEDVLEFPNGNSAEFYVTNSRNYSQVVALTSDDCILFVEQYKHGAGQVVYELPAGVIDDSEDVESCAMRELREETGFVGDQVIPLGSFFVASARMPTRAFGFLILSANQYTEQSFDEFEAITVHKIPLSEVDSLIQSGKITDLGSIAFLGLASKYLSQNQLFFPSPPRP